MGLSDRKEPIIGHYVALLAATVAVVLPYAFISVMSFSILLCLVIFAYMQRMDKEPESLIWNHMTFIIRTFWASLVVLFFSLILSLTVMLLAFQTGLMSISPLNPCMASEDFTLCTPNFIAVNKSGFIFVSVIVAAPILLYFLFRFTQGLVHVWKGKTV